MCSGLMICTFSPRLDHRVGDDALFMAIDGGFVLVLVAVFFTTKLFTFKMMSVDIFYHPEWFP